MRILVTGAAGFIGFHVAARLVRDGARVLGIDNLNGYYDPRLKHARLALLEHARFDFARLDIADRRAMEALFEKEEFTHVIHLAAQAGVRHSIERPHDYIDSNIAGFLNVLEGCRRQGCVRHLIYASSSSVYGGNTKLPFAVDDRTDHPVSLYAATKRANELMAHAYHRLFHIPATGLRFFTVYGPWGRPDMAPYKFARAIARRETIDIFNYGRMVRDFTYIDDIVEGLVRIALQPAEGFRLFNIGGNAPLPLMEFVRALENAFGRRARKRFRPIEPGDVIRTHADVLALERATGFRPSITLEEGVARFAEWYRDYHMEEFDDYSPRRAPDSREYAAAFRAS